MKEADSPNHQVPIALVCLTFFNEAVLDKFLSSLWADSNKFDIFIVENCSVNSPSIKKTIEFHRRHLNIIEHIYFYENITSNAYQIYLEDFFERNLSYRYVTVTDADFLCVAGWSDVALSIIRCDETIFSVSFRINDSHHMAKDIPTLKKISDLDFNNSNYIMARAGWVLKTFRYDLLKGFITYIRKYNIFFHDCEADVYGRHILGKKSVIAKSPVVNHLTWDHLSNEYMAQKNKFPDPWYHNKSSNAVVYLDRGGERLIKCSEFQGRYRHVWRKIDVENGYGRPIDLHIIRILDGKDIYRGVLTEGERDTFNVILPGVLSINVCINGSQINHIIVDMNSNYFNFELR